MTVAKYWPMAVVGLGKLIADAMSCRVVVVEAAAEKNCVYGAVVSKKELHQRYSEASPSQQSA